MVKKEYRNVLIIFIIILLYTGLFVYKYKSEQSLVAKEYERNDELLENSLKKISQQLREYNNDESKDNISKASTLSYTINEATNYFRESSHYYNNNHTCQLGPIFNIFEKNIKNNNIRALLDSSILPQLSSLFKSLFEDIENQSIANEIYNLLFEIWSKE